MTIRVRAFTLFAVAALALGACANAPQTGSANSAPDSTASGTTQRNEAVKIIDVRTPEEFAAGHVEGAVNIDIHSPDFASQIQQLDPQGQYAVYCRSGNRSTQAAQFMTDNGFTNVTNLGALEQAAQELNLPIVK
ncbi:MAG: rhodanese-like domain-containing protein [Actinomycetaceae bacterium]|nr:rhodanese-like domain-containing protein [Actinomycetaceae bacterium]